MVHLEFNDLYDNLEWREATYNYERLKHWYISENGILYNIKTKEYKYGRDNVKGKDKHLRVSIKHKQYYISRIVAEAFVVNENPERYKIVRHLNDDPYDNHYTNLKWGTAKQNTHDAIINGKNVYDEHRNYTIGEKHPMAILTEKDVKKIIKMLNKSIDLKEISNKFSVDVDVIRHIYKGKSWSYLTKDYLPFPEQESKRKPMNEDIKKAIIQYLETNPNAKATEICNKLNIERSNTIKTFIGKRKRILRKIND